MHARWGLSDTAQSHEYPGNGLIVGNLDKVRWRAYFLAAHQL